MHRFRFLAVLALAFLASPVVAHDTAPVERVEIQGLGSLDYQHLFTTTSQPGESMDAFVLRIAPRLREFSDAMGFEACGVMATDGERFGAVIGTNRAHAACGSAVEFVPDGMKATGETIHSHRQAGTYRANENDSTLMGGRAGKRFTAKDADEFSPQDLHAPGYLVGQRSVWHQAGRRSVRQIARLP